MIHYKRNADAPTVHPKTGGLVFAKPHEEDQSFSDFLTYVIHQEKTQGLRKSEVRYAQTRKPLKPHSPSSPGLHGSPNLNDPLVVYKVKALQTLTSISLFFSGIILTERQKKKKNNRKRQPPTRILLPLQRRAPHHPLGAHRLIRPPPSRPRRGGPARSHQPLDRQLLVHHRLTQGQLRECLCSDQGEETLCAVAAALFALCE